MERVWSEWSEWGASGASGTSGAVGASGSEWSGRASGASGTDGLAPPNADTLYLYIFCFGTAPLKSTPRSAGHHVQHCGHQAHAGSPGWK